jgi:large subunit ribosomal protein L11
MPNKEKVGKVTRQAGDGDCQVEAEGFERHNEEAALPVVAGTARSMGIDVLD